MRYASWAIWGDKFDQKLSSIVIDVTCPALILSSVMGTELPDRSLILPLLGVGFLTYVVLLVFGFGAAVCFQGP